MIEIFGALSFAAVPAAQTVRHPPHATDNFEPLSQSSFS